MLVVPRTHSLNSSQHAIEAESEIWSIPLYSSSEAETLNAHHSWFHWQVSKLFLLLIPTEHDPLTFTQTTHGHLFPMKTQTEQFKTEAFFGLRRKMKWVCSSSVTTEMLSLFLLCSVCLQIKEDEQHEFKLPTHTHTLAQTHTHTHTGTDTQTCVMQPVSLWISGYMTTFWGRTSFKLQQIWTVTNPQWTGDVRSTMTCFKSWNQNSKICLCLFCV